MADTPSQSPIHGNPAPQLTAEQKKSLEDLQSEIDFWTAEIKKAESIGINMDAVKKELQRAQSLRDQLLKTYG